MQLSAGTGVALYYQLKKVIREKIKNGIWNPGDQIPNEMDLVALYQVSRATVRQAVLELVREGLLVRKKAKGTFVAEPKYETDFTIQFCYPKEFGNKHDVVSRKVIEAGDFIGEIFGIEANKKVYDIVRLRYFNGEVIAIETVLLPEDRFPGLLEMDLGGRLFDILYEKYGVHITKFNCSIEPVILTGKEVKLLGLHEKKPALMLNRQCIDMEGKTYLLNKSIFRGDRCKLLFQQTEK